MSANILKFHPQVATSQTQPTDAIEEDIMPPERDILPTEILYRIFCSEDDHLHTLAMEYFLLDCD